MMDKVSAAIVASETITKKQKMYGATKALATFLIVLSIMSLFLLGGHVALIIAILAFLVESALVIWIVGDWINS